MAAPERLHPSVFRLRCVVCTHPRAARWKLPPEWQVDLVSGEVQATCSPGCRGQLKGSYRDSQTIGDSSPSSKHWRKKASVGGSHPRTTSRYSFASRKM